MRSNPSFQTPDRSLFSRLNLHRQVLVQLLLALLLVLLGAVPALGAQQLPEQRSVQP